MLHFAADTETTLITPTERVPRLVSLGLACDGYRKLFVAHDPDCREAAVALLRNASVWANAPFDIFVLLRQWPDLLPLAIEALEDGRVRDVQMRQKLIDISTGDFSVSKSYALDKIAAVYDLAVDKEDPWRLRYGELLGMPLEQWPDGARHYAERDIEVTWRIYQRQREHEAFDCEPNQVRGHIALAAQEIRGICTDQAQRARVHRRLTNEYNRAAHIALSGGLARWQGKAAPKLARNKKEAISAYVEEYTSGEYACSDTKTLEHTSDLFEGLNKRPLDQIKRTPTGIIQVSESEIKKLQLAEDHPLVAWQKMGSVQTQRKKLDAYEQPVIHSRYMPLIETGRTSLRSPNLQNQPRAGGFREILVPRPGHKFLIHDFGMAELVTLGQIQLDWLGRSRLADALRDGKDVHVMLAANIAGCSYEELRDAIKHAKAWLKKHGDDPSADPRVKLAMEYYVALRTLAKAPNFGYPGGLGAKRFVDFALGSYGIVVAEDEARRLKKQWLRTWPDMRDYFRYIDRWKQADGRYRVIQPRSERVRGACSYTEACNSPFQGLAADAAKHVMWLVWRATLDPASALFGASQVLFVHDENVVEVPETRAEDASAELERIMIDGFAAYCPDIPISVEGAVTDRYCK